MRLWKEAPWIVESVELEALDSSREMLRGLIHRNSFLSLCIIKSNTATSECCHQLQQGSLVPMHCKYSGEESSYSYKRSYQMNLLHKICKETNKIHSEIWGSHRVDYKWYCILGYDVAGPQSDWDRIRARLWYFCSQTSKRTQCCWQQVWSLLIKHSSKQQLVHRDHTSLNCMVANVLQGLAPLRDKLQSGVHCAVTVEMLFC